MSLAALSARKTCPSCGEAFEPDALFCPKDGARLEGRADHEAAPESDRYIGQTILGDIEVRAVAGAGAMGRVYRAHQRGIDRDVAVKILHRELSSNAQLVQRFHREAKIASKLQHPHVVEVFLAGQLPDDALYIVMEYLDGLSLSAALTAGGGSLPLKRALSIVLQICDAVGEGHVRGIVHRDLKPENVMLVRRGEAPDWVKVLDFGIAKVSLGEQSMETAAGLIFGTARYISPEGAQGSSVGPPGDVYSLAVILYHLLAGRTPFDAEQSVGLLIKHIHEAPPPLRAWPAAADVPEPIARVIMDNLAKDPNARATSARAFASALASAAREANVQVSDVGVLARLSLTDLAARSGALDATLDDAAAHPPPKLSAYSVAPSSTVPLYPSLAPSPAAPSRPERSTPGTELAPQVPTRGAGRTIVVLLAFLLGAVLAVLVTQQMKRSDDALEAHVARTRHALNESHYVSPPGDNVRDLVRDGLLRWPDDARFHAIRSDAAHELVTRAIAARSAGDLSMARSSIVVALELEPSDSTAKLLLTRYDAELKGANAETSHPTATIGVVGANIRAGGTLSLVATVSGLPKASTLGGARFLVKGPGLPAAGRALEVDDDARATFTPPRAGRYEITFEARAGELVLNAARSLDVPR